MLSKLGRNWDYHFALIEFAYSNSDHTSIKMAPYEALYGRTCKSSICWEEVGEKKLIGSKLVEEIMKKIRLIRKHLQTAQSRQKSYVDNRRRDLEFEVVTM